MTEAELAETIRDASGPLRIEGGATRTPPRDGAPLSTRGLTGIVTYEPGALTLIARTGTPMAEIEAALAAEGQALAFEPMDHRAVLGTSGVPTIGGVVAANVSGPRRILAGACRDHLLGVRFIDGQGRVLKNGGRVMKNVTGLDLGKLLCGSHGTLGVLTEVALKTLPLAESAETLAFSGVTETEAVGIFCTALGTPFEVSGAAFSGGTAWLRIEGLAAQVAYRRERLTALIGRPVDVLDGDATMTLWRGIRDAEGFAGSTLPLWKVLVKPTDAPATAAALRTLGGDTALDWAGGLIWYQGAGDVRSIAPHSTLVRGTGPAFAPEPPAVARLSQGLRRQFDPRGILNSGLMGH